MKNNNAMNEKIKAFERIVKIVDELREKCPWDGSQTFESLRRLTIEETYELGDAILDKDFNEIKKEAGDLLLHILFYAKIGEEQKKFDLTDIINSLCEKMIYRHPHIYGDVKVKNASDVERNWEVLKLKEKGRKKGTVLEGVPKSLPALVKADRIQEKVSAVGFDWKKKEDVWEKVKEEMYEVQEEMDLGNRENMENEFGDFFFSMVNAARLYGIDPESALERTNNKFIRRFNYIESKTIKNGKNIKEISLDEMDKLWKEAKNQH